jgi:hypothetical protein
MAHTRADGLDALVALLTFVATLLVGPEGAILAGVAAAAALVGPPHEWHVDLCILFRNMELGQKHLCFPGLPFVTLACQSYGFLGTQKTDREGFAHIANQ